MAKDRQSKGEKVRAKSYRNPNLLSHYHELSTRVFYNGGRANEYLHNLFLKAAKNGEEERIRNFLARSSKNSNVNLNYKEKATGNTAVVLAASRNHVNIVKMLLSYGADITLLNDQGQSIFDLAPDSIIPMLLASVERQGITHQHLLQAAWQGNSQILRRLLSSQASLDVNCKNADGMTPLLLVTRDVNLFEKIEKNVAEKGYNPLEVVKELLQHKADCSITTSDGKSPLHYIAHNMGPKAKDMADLIIEDTNSKLELSDKSNNHPIHLASRYDNRPVLLALINGGADVNARGQLGQTPLHVAAAHGHEKFSSALLSSGADVTIVDDQGYSPVDVCKNRKVKMVLKEAWVEQTRKASSQLRRSSSAPTGLMNDEVNTIRENVPESVLTHSGKKQTSPRNISGESLTTTYLPGVSRTDDSQVPHPPKAKSKHIRRSLSMTNKTPGYMAPRPPGTSPSDSNRIKYRGQTRQISSFSSNAGLQSCRQEWELPKLSIKNIELRVASALHSDVTFQSPCNRYGTIQRCRLLKKSSSLPLTPNTCESTNRMSDYSSSQDSGRKKLPKTLAPLSREERASPADTRQDCSGNSLYSGHELVGDVLDLDNLQSPSKCQPSSAKIFVFNSEDRNIVQPPSSPCEEIALAVDYPPSPHADNELEYKENDDKEIELDNNENTVRENIDQETVKDTKNEEFIAGSIKEKNENNTEEPISIENKETHSSCNDWVVNGGCDDDDDCCKTQTFSTTDLSKFWIPCTKNGETGLGKTSNSELNSPEENSTNELKSTNSVTNKMDNDKERTIIADKARKNENSKNSVSFYVDFGGIKTPKSVNRTCKCGKTLNNENLNKCEECTNRLPEKKTFWISLDGETSDGETEGVSGKKKCVERKGSSSEEGERFSRREQSLPENKLLLKPKFISKNYIDLHVETQEQTLREKFLIVSEDYSFAIQPKRPEDSRNEVSEAVAKDDEELEDGLKFYSEDTFVIEKNVQESVGELKSTITRGTSERDQEVDEGNDGVSELSKDSKENKRVIAGEHGEMKSSIVLQSLSLDDDQQHNEENENIISIETTNPHCSREVKHQIESAKEVVKTLKKDKPVFLKTAWSNDGPSEEQPLGVQICNAFPSPVPPVNVKPEVQPPIGNSLGKTKPRKTNSGKLKKKASNKESKKKDDKNTIRTEQPSSCGKRGKKGKKGKEKKTEPTFKEISVHQSFGCTGYDSVTSSVACEIKEGMLSPDLDKVPTLSIDSRGTTKLVKRKFSILSPIPESPRSTVSVTPRTGDDGGSGEKNVTYTLEVPETSQVNEELVKQEERRTELMEEEKVVTGDEDDDGGGGIVNDGRQDEQSEVFDEGVDEGADEADGGMFLRFLNMCMPRLKMVSPESDSEALASKGDDDDDHDDDDGTINNAYQEEQLIYPVDEADQDMEDLIQDILENYDHIKKDADHESAQEVVHHVDFSVNNHSFSEQANTGAIQETSVTSSDTNSLKADHHIEKQRDEKKNLKDENWTKSYVRQMPDFVPWELDAPDDVFIQNEKEDEERFGSTLNEEIMSDDSSYVSCDSLSYAVSESSTTASNDSYFSSQESFPRGIGSSSHDVTIPGSVDIILHEQIHKPQTNASNSSNSGSNDSRSTLRPRSNSNSSETSMPSFFSSASRGLVRSQVSSGSGSLSSATSCGEELQWQKGSILGKGGFGTVYLGLVNTGEMIAVKQVELNNKDECEAEKQYDKLQEEVLLLKSLRHQNIVKYIGTCLNDNSVVNIFMEYVPGGSIAQALKRFGAFVEPVFHRYTKQILSGVDYLHKKNVIHRDIKGGNIMLMPNGVIKLIDFGCAKRLCMSFSLSRSSIMHSMKGTPYWMAPEVIKETSGQGTKSDIWSIGCTVYEMATGNPPWSPMDPFAAMFAIGNGNTVPQLDNSFSEAARNFTAACMTREPCARPSAYELLQHEFITQLF